jgi:hypothetical protein
MALLNGSEKLFEGASTVFDPALLAILLPLHFCMALVEEVLFRGYLLGALMRRWGRTWRGGIAMVLLSSLVFGGGAHPQLDHGQRRSARCSRPDRRQRLLWSLLLRSLSPLGVDLAGHPTAYAGQSGGQPLGVRARSHPPIRDGAHLLGRVGADQRGYPAAALDPGVDLPEEAKSQVRRCRRRCEPSWCRQLTTCSVSICTWPSAFTTSTTVSEVGSGDASIGDVSSWLCRTLARGRRVGRSRP